MKTLKHIAFFILSGIFTTQTKAQLTVSLSLVNPVCNHDGVVAASIQNGFTTNTYYWYGPNLLKTTFTSASTDTLFNYQGGYIWVYVVPGNGGNSGQSNMTVPFPFQLSTTISPDTCPLQTGSISIQLTGGVPPITYAWTKNGLPYPGSTNVLTSLTGGFYDCLISDAAGCQMFLHDADTGQNAILVPSVNAISLSMSSTPANCINGTATVGVTGGTGPYSYIWSNGQTVQTATGLTANGFYSVIVTDANGCLKQGYASIANNSNFNIVSSVTHAHCTLSDGAATAIVTGGTPPYAYHWNTLATTSSITGVPAGNYQVTAVDAMGCVVAAYPSIQSLSPVIASYSTVASACTTATGSSTLNVSGGTLPYSYLWYTSPVQSTVSATGIGAGNYNFIVTDAQGCTAGGTVPILQNTTLAQTISVTPNTGCLVPNGTATLNPAGGVLPYTYSWSNSQTLLTATGLGGYIYGTVTDGAGCSVTQCTTIPDIFPMTTSFIWQIASCLYTNDGIITANHTGGTAPYQFYWSNGASTQTITSLLPGYYYVNITDAAGCQISNWMYLGYNTVAPCTGTIEGNVFFDMNQNCLFDWTEPGLENIPLLCGSTGEVQYTDPTGHYSFTVPVGNSTISQLSIPYRYQVCPGTNPFTVNVPLPGAVINQDVADSLILVNDLVVNSYNYYQLPIVGHSFIRRVTYFNQGTVSLPIQGYYDYHPQAPFVSSSLPPAALNVPLHMAEWNAPLLVPLKYYKVDVTHQVPVTVPINTWLTYNDSILPVSGDTTWWNNYNFHSMVTLGSYDPNYKEVSPSGTGPQGFISTVDSVLEYVIHFQNLGNYYAQQIIILDTLDNDLDWTTLRPGYSTHPHQTEISSAGILKMSFNYINLPAVSQDSVLSNGFAVYTIKQKPNLANGTQIHNSADIFFDFNEGVKTNTTVNTILTTGMPESFQEFSLTVFPNPCDGNFSLQLNNEAGGICKISLLSMVGQLISESTIFLNKSSRITIPAGHLHDGMYLLRVTCNGDTGYAKLIVRH